MKKNYQARLVFPSVFHEFSFDKEDFKKKELTDFCYSQKKLHPKSLHRSNRGGWHSPVLNVNDENPMSVHLRKGLAKSVFTTLKPHLKVNVEYWIMINGPNCCNAAHTHPNAHMSGVFWIKSPKNSGNLKFLSPSNFKAYVELNSYVSNFTTDTNVHEAYVYTPRAGNMITFPSHVVHEVLPNKSKQDRIAVSYNITLSGWDDDEWATTHEN